MDKRVIVIASGETERRALPHLLLHLRDEGIVIDPPIRTPPRHRALTGINAGDLILSAWYEKQKVQRPDKFVVLVDADTKDPQSVVNQIQDEIKKTAVAYQVPIPVLVAAAKWHLEAWFFADPASLRDYLGRNLGTLDTTRPDEIKSPKNCLRQLLKASSGEIYTARISEEIAQQLSVSELRSRSRSFASFELAVRNGSKPIGGESSGKSGDAP